MTLISRRRRGTAGLHTLFYLGPVKQKKKGERRIPASGLVSFIDLPFSWFVVARSLSSSIDPLLLSLSSSAHREKMLPGRRRMKVAAPSPARSPRSSGSRCSNPEAVANQSQFLHHRLRLVHLLGSPPPVYRSSTKDESKKKVKDRFLHVFVTDVPIRRPKPVYWPRV